MKFLCSLCRKYGHWKKSHNEDWSLPSYVESDDSTDSSGSSTSGQDNEPGSKNKNKTFILPHSATDKQKSPTKQDIRHLVDDGAHYSAIRQPKLKLLSETTVFTSVTAMEPIPASLKGHINWKHSSGQHSSAACRILGSVVLCATSDYRKNERITHLVLEGSSK